MKKTSFYFWGCINFVVLLSLSLLMSLSALPAAPQLIPKTKDVYRVLLAAKADKTDSLIATQKCIYSPKGQLLRQWTEGLQNPVIYYYDYDAKGRLWRTIARTQNGGLLMLWLYWYDKNNRKTAESHIIGTDYEVCTEYMYDNAPVPRLLLWRTTVNGDSQKMTFVHQTFEGPNGTQPLTETATDNVGRVQYVRRNAYNAKGQLTTAQSLDADGKLRQEIAYAYNKTDSLATEIVYKETRKEEQKTEYAYDNTGKQLTDKRVFRFEAGNWILQQRVHYTYTSTGDVAEEIIYRQQKDIPDYKLMYLYNYYK